MRSVVLATALVCALTTRASAWGWAGHTLISSAAAASLPDTLPPFVRSAAAGDEIAALGPEADRSKDAGKTHDADLDTGHYVDVGDDGKVAGVVDLRALPLSREAYDTALRGAGTDQYAMGYLPYAIIDGWQQIAKDFAIWRVDRVGELSGAPAERASFSRDRTLREELALRDIGYWSHFVGDASQPLHVSIHYNGWGSYPNPGGYTQSRATHAAFESAFVRANASLAGVEAKMRPLAASSLPIEAQVGSYLEATSSNVVPFYELEERGLFAAAAPEAVAFADARLADGASELRDLIVDAWDASAQLRVGYPHGITPAQAESGTVPDRTLLGGGD